MKRQIVIWCVVLLTVVNVASLSTLGYHRWFGEHEKSERRFSREGRRSRVEADMALSSDQIKKRDEMRKALGEEMRTLRTALKSRKEAFYEVLSARKTDRAKIDQFRMKVDSLELEIKKRFIDHTLAQKEILTPEQQEKLFSAMRRKYSNGNRRRD